MRYKRRLAIDVWQSTDEMWLVIIFYLPLSCNWKVIQWQRRAKPFLERHKWGFDQYCLTFQPDLTKNYIFQELNWSFKHFINSFQISEQKLHVLIELILWLLFGRNGHVIIHKNKQLSTDNLVYLLARPHTHVAIDLPQNFYVMLQTLAGLLSTWVPAGVACVGHGELSERCKLIKRGEVVGLL